MITQLKNLNSFNNIPLFHSLPLIAKQLYFSFKFLIHGLNINLICKNFSLYQSIIIL